LGVPATINQACAALTCGPKILPAFLFAQLKIGYPHLRRLGQGGNQPNLNAGLVNQFKVLVPGIAEQRAFVAALDALSRITDGARKHLVANERLFASLQHKAFRGEL
jgi:type I restriction enzyme S subunit